MKLRRWSIILGVLILFGGMAYHSFFIVNLSPVNLGNPETEICECGNSTLCDNYASILDNRCKELEGLCGDDCSGDSTGGDVVECQQLRDELENDITWFDLTCIQEGCGTSVSCCPSDNEEVSGTCCVELDNGDFSCLDDKVQDSCNDLIFQMGVFNTTFTENKLCSEVKCGSSLGGVDLVEDIGSCCLKTTFMDSSLGRQNWEVVCMGGLTEQECSDYATNESDDLEVVETEFKKGVLACMALDYSNPLNCFLGDCCVMVECPNGVEFNCGCGAGQAIPPQCQMNTKIKEVCESMGGESWPCQDGSIGQVINPVWKDWSSSGPPVCSDEGVCGSGSCLDDFPESFFAGSCEECFIKMCEGDPDCDPDALHSWCTDEPDEYNMYCCGPL